VLECKEFDDSQACPVKGARKDVLRPTISGAKSGAAKYKGLCSNCDNRQTCIYPKPESGVWHCEEYQ